MTRIFFFLLVIGINLTINECFPQQTPFHHWTFLPGAYMDEIIGEASGETAYNHMIEMSGYNRDRLNAEYATTFLEARYTVERLKEYGIDEAKIDRFPGRQTWDGIRGELWEVSPWRNKIADYDDLRAVLASGSKNADITAELIWIGEGREEDFHNRDVAGKIAVTSGNVSRVHNLAVERGAEGVISFNSPRPLEGPVQIPWRGIRGDNRRFAFNLNAREGYLLRNRLLQGEKIKVHAVVEATMRDFELQIPTAVIKGTNPHSGEIIISAHLFEGYTKQGANDNISGSAAILEVANTLNTLIIEGRLSRPVRNIRFIWVPEFSGTIPWVKANKELMENTLCNINLDIVGLWLSRSYSHFCLMRTTYGNPHYLNDVMEHYYRFVGETNRESITSRRFSQFPNRIVAPSGSDEPFYYKIETHYGASDHEVFNDWGVQVPGIMMITWPDIFYHTSEDRPYNSDPTQLKRVIVITAAAVYTIANADDDMAINIAGETYSNASKRIGHQLARGLDELNQATPENFNHIYKKVRGYIEATVLNEKETLGSVLELVITDMEKVKQYVKTLKSGVEDMGKAHLVALEQHMQIVAGRIKSTPADISLSSLEKKASNMIPKPTGKVKENGYRGWTEAIRVLPEKFLEKYQYEDVEDTRELPRLTNGSHSALDIKKMLDTQLRTESDLKAIMNCLEVLKEAGLIEF